MNLIKRFLAAIIKIIAGLVAILGLIALVVGLIDGSDEFTIPGAVMLGVGFVVYAIATKVGKKAKVNSRHKAVSKCKHCGGAYNSRFRYSYDMSKATKDAVSILLKVPVDITLTCSNCGRNKTLYEYVEVSGCGDCDQEIKESVDSMMSEYIHG